MKKTGLLWGVLGAFVLLIVCVGFCFIYYVGNTPAAVQTEMIFEEVLSTSHITLEPGVTLDPQYIAQRINSTHPEWNGFKVYIGTGGQTASRQVIGETGNLGFSVPSDFRDTAYESLVGNVQGDTLAQQAVFERLLLPGVDVFYVGSVTGQQIVQDIEKIPLENLSSGASDGFTSYLIAQEQQQEALNDQAELSKHYFDETLKKLETIVVLFLGAQAFDRVIDTATSVIIFLGIALILFVIGKFFLGGNKPSQEET